MAAMYDYQDDYDNQYDDYDDYDQDYDQYGDDQEDEDPYDQYGQDQYDDDDYQEEEDQYMEEEEDPYNQYEEDQYDEQDQEDEYEEDDYYDPYGNDGYDDDEYENDPADEYYDDGQDDNDYFENQVHRQNFQPNNGQPANKAPVTTKTFQGEQKLTNEEEYKLVLESFQKCLSSLKETKQYPERTVCNDRAANMHPRQKKLWKFKTKLVNGLKSVNHAKFLVFPEVFTSPVYADIVKVYSRTHYDFRFPHPINPLGLRSGLGFTRHDLYLFRRRPYQFETITSKAKKFKWVQGQTLNPDQIQSTQVLQNGAMMASSASRVSG